MGLYVDTATIGHFKDLKVTKRALREIKKKLEIFKRLSIG
jgi:hypothetical protein